MSAVAGLGRDVGVQAACRALEVASASYYRWWRPPAGGLKPRPRPPLALSQSEEQAVLDLLHCERFVDVAPPEAYATLLEEQAYLCSTRTMYRVLERHAEVRERRDQLRHPLAAKPELLATAPNQVWSWDIERHEALSNRAVMKEHRCRPVAASRVKLRAA